VLGREPVTEDLELRVVVDDQVQHAAGVVDAGADVASVPQCHLLAGGARASASVIAFWHTVRTGVVAAISAVEPSWLLSSKQ
jgi:hypothetical protein